MGNGESAGERLLSGVHARVANFVKAVNTLPSGMVTLTGGKVVIVRDRDSEVSIQITLSQLGKFQTFLYCLGSNGVIYFCENCQLDNRVEVNADQLDYLLAVIDEFDKMESADSGSILNFLSRLAG